MSKFVARDGSFWLNDEPKIIQAGEFHYFRTPKDQWAHRLNLLKQAGFNCVACYIPWLWHQLEEGVSDFDGHSHPMRDLQGFLDLAAEMSLMIIPRPGPYIMAETINEGIPQWVLDKYPQVAFISQENKVQNIVSYLHPDFLACVSKWYQAIFHVLAPRQITQGGKIIMIQLDNEMGMMPWVRNIMDTNPDTIYRFAAYLQHRYGDSLILRYPVTSLLDFLNAGILYPTAEYAEKIVEDYRLFYREYLREYASFLWSEARENGMQVLPVINIHGFANGGKTFPIGISQLLSVMEIPGMLSATDVYPGYIGEGNFHQLLLVNEMTKALHNPQQALFSIEFQAGGNHDFGNGQSSLYDLHTRLCLSTEMRAINHYLFFDGENDPLLSPVRRHDWGHPVRKDGSLRKHYARYPRLSKVLATYGPDFVLSRPQTVTSIGFMIDQFMTEVNNSFSKDAANIITHQREVILFDCIARGLALTHRPFKALEVTRATLDVTRMPLLWMMMEKQCNAATQKKLVNYVQQGGTLILIGRMCTEEFDHTPCTILKDALGIDQIDSSQPFQGESIQVYNHQEIPVSFLETYAGDFSGTFAQSRDGAIAGFVKCLGNGKVLMLGAAFTANTLEDIDLVNQIALEMQCAPLFETSTWVDIRISRGDHGSFIFINNYQDDPVDTAITLEGAVLFDGHPVYLPARTGQILPLDWWLNEDVIIHYATSELQEVNLNGSELIIKAAQNDFFAELTLRGYSCDPSINVTIDREQRIKVHTTEGAIRLTKHD